MMSALPPHPATTSPNCRRSLGLLAWLVAAVLFLLACSSSDSDTSDGFADTAGDSSEPEEPTGRPSVDDSGPGGAADAEFDGDDAVTGGGTGADLDGTLPPADVGREISYTADIHVEVPDVAEAGRAALDLVQANGGFLFDRRESTRDTPTVVMTFRVGPDAFQGVVDALSEIGTVISSQVSAQDVTERVVDLESRITTAEASVDRLRAFLSQATDLSEVAALEGELLQRETNLELLRGQLRGLRDRIDLSTITLQLTQELPGPEVDLAETLYAGHDNGVACPGTEDTTVGEDDDVTVCFVVTNTGDTHLGRITIRDDAYDLSPDDLVMVEGDLDIPLAPGQRIVVAGEITATGSRSARGRVEALPVTADGEDLRLGRVVAAGNAFLDVEPDTSLPGILDGLRSGWDAIRYGVAGLLVGVGFGIWFVWVIPVLWWILRRLRRRRVE
jgi:hypothetical protein